jgi:hypothetical protein
VPNLVRLGFAVAISVSLVISGAAPAFAQPAQPAQAAATSETVVMATPTITGSPRVGEPLFAEVADFTPGAVLTYRWYVNGKLIGGEESEVYIPTAKRVGKKITVKVTATLEGFTSRSRVSKPTATVKRAVMEWSVPQIGGVAEITQQLCADPGFWTEGTTFKYQWYLNGSKISGKTKQCVTITSRSWKNKQLTVVVTGSLAGYNTVSKRSAKSDPIYVPGRTDPSSVTSCPSWAPIKGNASSRIYHMPGQRFYKVTHPEDCFSSESAARAAGYRKAKV